MPRFILYSRSYCHLCDDMLKALNAVFPDVVFCPTGGISRQTANYHLRVLETHGLVELVEERVRGSKAERVLRATASSFVISPR